MLDVGYVTQTYKITIRTLLNVLWIDRRREMPSRLLPPLNALRAFEAAARHQNLSQAALELGVTHGAISHQVAKLERFIKAKLFERHHHKVVLTRKGAAYAAHLQVLFDQLHAATVANFSDGNLLRIGMSPTFAIRLLVPKLLEFTRRFPEINVQVSTHIDAPWPHAEDIDIDVGVWVGDGNWPNVVCERLCPEQLLPVGSPTLLHGRAIGSADDLAPFTLLHALRRPADWRLWLQAARATRVDPNAGVKLEHSGLVYQGAVDGLGLAMAQTIFVLDDLSHRRLVPVIDRQLRTTRAYYVGYPHANGELPKVQKFVGWLKEEIAALSRSPMLNVDCMVTTPAVPVRLDSGQHFVSEN